MGRTFPTTLMLIQQEEQSFVRFRRALRRSDEAALDDLVAVAHQQRDNKKLVCYESCTTVLCGYEKNRYILKLYNQYQRVESVEKARLDHRIYVLYNGFEP